MTGKNMASPLLHLAVPTSQSAPPSSELILALMHTPEITSSRRSLRQRGGALDEGHDMWGKKMNARLDQINARFNEAKALNDACFNEAKAHLDEAKAHTAREAQLVKEQIESIAFSSIAFASIAFASIAFASIAFTSNALASIALSSIALASIAIATIASIDTHS